MSGDNRDEFLTAMAEEIAAFETHGTWLVVTKETMPQGSNLLPGTWALQTKWYPDGRMPKHMAHYCVRGERYGVTLTVVYALNKMQKHKSNS
jgi:hypothetical protein